MQKKRGDGHYSRGDPDLIRDTYRIHTLTATMICTIILWIPACVFLMIGIKAGYLFKELLDTASRGLPWSMSSWFLAQQVAPASDIHRGVGPQA